MGQNRESGAAANAYGRETAPKIAGVLGATMLGSESNEALLDGKRVVIKIAGKNTTSVGVTYSMLEGLETVIAAFQHKTGPYEVFSLSAPVFLNHARDSRSGGGDARVGLVSRKVFETFGKRIKVVRNV